MKPRTSRILRATLFGALCATPLFILNACKDRGSVSDLMAPKQAICDTDSDCESVTGIPVTLEAVQQ